MRKLTEFIFFKNTPLNDFQNTIHFSNNEERDDYFLNRSPFSSIHYEVNRFNWIRDRQTLVINISYYSFLGVNYCTFLSDFEPNVRYYAHVVDYKYLNDNAIEVDLLIDGIMTFCQNDTLKSLNNLTVFRKHLNENDYYNRLEELKNNDDYLATFSKKYTHEDSITFKEFDVLIHSTADLTADFGTVDDPKIETPEGQTYDKITSPVALYVIKQTDFKKFMKALSPYAWIAQNLVKIVLIPKQMLNERYDKVKMKSTDFDGLYELRNNDGTLPFLDDDLKKVSKTNSELLSIFNLKKDEEHLLRNEYTTTEIYNFDGQRLMVDNGKLSRETGFRLKTKLIAGYHNEIAIFVSDYNTRKLAEKESDIYGSFLNDGMFIKDFDNIPILIDNYNLALAQSANRRALAESQLVSNKIRNVFDNSADIKDRFYDAVSIVSNVTPMTLFSKFNDEHNFYKNQQAEFADMALQSNTITEQSTNNSLSIANDFFGIHVKHAQPTKEEWGKIKKYYKLFGFHVNENGATIDPTTQTICDYVQFTGNYIIPNVPVALNEMIKARFENGVRLWHNNNTANPMSQDVLKNTWRN